MALQNMQSFIENTKHADESSNKVEPYSGRSATYITYITLAIKQFFLNSLKCLHILDLDCFVNMIMPSECR